MQTYFIHDEKGEAGPFTLEELKARKISRDTHVWKEGMSTWQPASSLSELEPLYSVPPPFLGDNMRVPAVSSESTAFRVGKNIGMALVIVAVMIFLFWAGFNGYDYFIERNKARAQQTEEVSRKFEDDQRKFVRENIRSFVTAERSSYTYSELGGIFNLKMTVNNNSNYLLERVKIKIDYIKSDGSIWDNKIVEFNYIQPNSKITLPVEDTHRGVKVSYDIISIKSTTLNL